MNKKIVLIIISLTLVYSSFGLHFILNIQSNNFILNNMKSGSILSSCTLPLKIIDNLIKNENHLYQVFSNRCEKNNQNKYDLTYYFAKKTRIGNFNNRVLINIHISSNIFESIKYNSRTQNHNQQGPPGFCVFLFIFLLAFFEVLSLSNLPKEVIRLNKV